MIAVAAPERTCVGCRRKRGQDELVRLVASHGLVVKARPGEPRAGAPICVQKRQCLEAAEKKRAFARAFRGPVTLDPEVRAMFARPGNDERR